MLLDVSKLWLYLLTPKFFNISALSLVIKPKDVLTSMSSLSFSNFIVLHICIKSCSGGALYAQTIQKLFAPLSLAASACAKITSGVNSGYFSILVVLKVD